MSVYIDRKYLLLSSSRLERFSEKNTDLFNFRCPICGDSKKNRTKARGFVYRKGNDYFYVCHNCNYGTTFSKFLKIIDEPLYRQYSLERFAKPIQKKVSKNPPELFGTKPSDVFDKVTIHNLRIPKISELNSDHPARKYIESRRIPSKYQNEIFYAEDFKSFMDETFPEHGKQLSYNDPRIVLCYTDKNGAVTNIAGRTLGKSKMRYVTVKITEDKKVFGLHRIDFSKCVNVVEGQFDSFFVENCIACGDSNLIGMVKDLKLTDFVLIYDNEPRNKELNKQIHKAIESDYPIVLFPERIEAKDINEMILSGMTESDISRIIKNNTYAGLEAKLKHSFWKK